MSFWWMLYVRIAETQQLTNYFNTTDLLSLKVPGTDCVGQGWQLLNDLGLIPLPIITDLVLFLLPLQTCVIIKHGLLQIFCGCSWYLLPITCWHYVDLRPMGWGTLPTLQNYVEDCPEQRVRSIEMASQGDSLGSTQNYSKGKRKKKITWNRSRGNQVKTEVASIQCLQQAYNSVRLRLSGLNL
jgi:hypothetical protein